MHGIADIMLPKLLTPETVSKRPEVVKRVRDMMLKTKPEGGQQHCAAWPSARIKRIYFRRFPYRR